MPKAPKDRDVFLNYCDELSDTAAGEEVRWRRSKIA